MRSNMRKYCWGKKDMKLISIIVPVYNVENYVLECLKSISKQTYSNIEVILVNDGSTDNSLEICEDFAGRDKRFRVLTKPNGGLSDARNYGLKYASGDEIAFVDSDDVIEMHMIEYLHELKKRMHADISICDCAHCYSLEDVKYSNASYEQKMNSEEAICQLLYQKSFLVSAWGKLYDRKLFDTIKFPVGMIYEDSAIMYKIFDEAQDIAYGNACLYGYFHREDSLTTKKFNYKNFDILYICDDMEKFFCKSQTSIKKAVKSYKISACLRIYMNSPREEQYIDKIKQCENYITNNCNEVLRDKNIRTKLRGALILYKYAKFIMPIVYKKIDRWK